MLESDFVDVQAELDFQNSATPIHFANVHIQSDFWVPRIASTLRSSLPEIYNQLKQTGRWDALRLQWKPGDPNKPHQFWDSDVAKWTETACYALHNHSSESLQQLVGEVVQMLKTAQQSDGYLNSYFTVVDPQRRWKDIAWSHEMYCCGHLLEAALAHKSWSSSNEMLDTMNRYVEHIASIFGPGDDQKHGYPGHEELELALLKSFETTGNKDHLRLAEYFILERGRVGPEGHYYDVEASLRGDPPRPGPGPPLAERYSYHQAHKPVCEQEEIQGHAVRAMYLLTAMAHLARLNRDTRVLSTCRKLWSSTLRKMYITGGIGAISEWEGFGPDHFLPNETGYLETCAAVGLIFFAHQMVLIDPFQAEYMDILERTCYNAALVGMSLDGTRFFYDNPTATIGRNVSRKDWFEVACCPPNITRLINSLGKYVYSVGSGGLVHVHLLLQSTTRLLLPNIGQVTIVQKTSWPWGADAGFIISPKEASDMITLSIRIPEGVELSRIVKGKSLPHPYGSRFLVIKPGNGEVTLDMKIQIRKLLPHPLDINNRGCASFAYGPFIYCAETVDNEFLKDLRNLVIPTNVKFRTAVDSSSFALWSVNPVVLEATAKDLCRPGEKKMVRLIPMFLWANRGLSDYRIWIPEG